MKNIRVFSVLAALLLVSACGDVKDDLGLTKQAPDEFAVVKRAPLTLPPDYNLRPPQPGAPRPQEQTTSTQARQTVFGEVEPGDTRKSKSSGEDLFLERAGVGEASPDIRRVIDEETGNLVDKNKPVVDKLLDLASDNKEGPATLVDPKKEAERIRQNAEAGKPVTEGETPTLDP